MKSLNGEGEIQDRFNQFWIISTVGTFRHFSMALKISFDYKTISILHTLSLFYIVVCNRDVGLQFTHLIVNPRDSQFKSDHQRVGH